MKTIQQVVSMFGTPHAVRHFRLLLLTCAIPLTAAAQSPPAVDSPEVQPDRRITFRFRAPNARKVVLQSEFAWSTPMKRDRDGVWSVTTGPLEPDLYAYWFTVDDGLPVLDPANCWVRPNLQSLWSLVEVPSTVPLPWDVQDVPHGIVHRHHYRSKIIGDDRDFYVYTPPGYDPGGQVRYPVLYLLHGFGDEAVSWSSVGRADAILDNLIAQGKARPMILVMPLGYGRPPKEAVGWMQRHRTDAEIWLHGKGSKEDVELWLRFITGFRDALLAEVMPQVEQGYRVAASRESQAIAGLSMGGTQSLYTGLNRPDRFAWVGAFSSGTVPKADGSFGVDFPGLDAKGNPPLRLVWLGCGKDDFVLRQSRQLDELLRSKGVPHIYKETEGNHTFLVWRRYLTEFAPLLFRRD